MATEVTIEMFGDVHFRYMLRKVARRAIDAQPVMRSIGEDFLAMIENRFQHEGGVVDKWAQLTIEYASKRGSAHPILVDSGDMLLALTDPENIDVARDGVAFKIPTSQRQKAESAQYGFHTVDSGSRESTVRFVEPRPFINITPPDRFAMGNKIAHYIATGEVGHLYDFAD